MRVTTGAARGRKLTAPEGLDTRPTSGLVKEAVFSVIQFEVEGAAVLDLFAGSGQMGVEALSRGARSCDFVDTSKQSRAAIEKNLKHTGLSEKAKVMGTDALAFLRGQNRQYDIIFLDPPYGQGLPEKVLPLAAAAVSKRGVLICESAKAEPMPEEAAELKKFREYHYGKTKITVYRNVDN
jgi:16S rRNA (guanine(966)-N(2))-methyltransferase RsmD